MPITFLIRERCLIKLTLCLLLLALNVHSEAAQTDNTIYAPDPHHLWNRLNTALFLRTAPDGKQFGLDELDILYWARTTHLLVAPSHQQALTALDEFLQNRGEMLIRDPFKRALLQRDLWELFDWSARQHRPADQTQAAQDLQSRLVVLMRRLVLTTNEIALLPDNYAESQGLNLPDLPRDLFQTNGNWVHIGVNGYNETPIAPTHVAEFKGHSSFDVFVNLPGGQKAAEAYLKELRSFRKAKPAWVYRTNDSNQEPFLNPQIPQFPANTEWALVRRMSVIDTTGQLRTTPVIESIQVRRYKTIKRILSNSDRNAQEFFEFQMDRRQSGKLRAIGKEERGFPFVHFRGLGIDLFEDYQRNPNHQVPPNAAQLQSRLLETCVQCHNAPGIFSVPSYTGFISTDPARYPADLAPALPAREFTAMNYWKQNQFDWGLLQGLWRNADQP